MAGGMNLRENEKMAGENIIHTSNRSFSRKSSKNNKINVSHGLITRASKFFSITTRMYFFMKNISL